MKCKLFMLGTNHSLQLQHQGIKKVNDSMVKSLTN